MVNVDIKWETFAGSNSEVLSPKIKMLSSSVRFVLKGALGLLGETWVIDSH